MKIPSNLSIQLMFGGQLIALAAMVSTAPANTAFTDDDWSSLGGAPNNRVYASATDESGNLYVGGTFTSIGGVAASRIAKWDGESWSPLGSGVNNVVQVIFVSGKDVYVGGGFTSAGRVGAQNIAKWNGRNWSALGSGTNDRVTAITTMGDDLYVGGQFSSAGGVTVNNIAKWNGRNWSSLGSGTSGNVLAFAAMGTDLFVGGRFNQAGGMAANHIAKWDGSDWSPVGSGLAGLCVCDFAVIGSDLYAGGEISRTCDFTVENLNGIAKWDGSAWSHVGTGFYRPDAGQRGSVNALAVSGTDLYAGGAFTEAGGIPAQQIAKWDGSNWCPLGSGVSDGGSLASVNALTTFGPDLYIGGRLSTAGGKPIAYLAHAFLGELVMQPVGLLGVEFDGSIARLLVAGPPSESVLVEASSDLLVWEPLTTIILGEGPMMVDDPGADGMPRRFYRAKASAE